MIDFGRERRRLVAGVASSAMMLGLAACGDKDRGNDKDVGAVEDLMREHGVLRRIILAYRFCAGRLRGGGSVDPQALQRAAILFRNFGEDYHERKLEEAHIFPALKKAGGPAAAYVDVLTAQHNKGREITDYMTGTLSKGTIGSGDTEALAAAMDGLELMYEHHTAREDTIVFPAWKATMSKHDLDEMGEKFEDIEKQQFGKDGFEDAINQIGGIEQALGIADISQFTPK